MSDENRTNIGREEMLKMTAQVAGAYFGNNSVPSAQISDIIKSVLGSLASLGAEPAAPQGPRQKPAVPIKRSVTPDFVICLEDGKKMKMLKRHLRTDHNLTPAEYRARWGLPADYPVVAPSYAKMRSAFAKKIGLGRKPKETTPKAKAKRARPKPTMKRKSMPKPKMKRSTPR
jgi:predicted transcriptional regulator